MDHDRHRHIYGVSFHEQKFHSCHTEYMRFLLHMVCHARLGGILLRLELYTSYPQIYTKFGAGKVFLIYFSYLYSAFIAYVAQPHTILICMYSIPVYIIYILYIHCIPGVHDIHT